jgi:hypothetical protein
MDLAAETFEDFFLWWVDANKFMEWIDAHPTDDLEVLSMLYHPDGPEIQQQAEAYAGLLADGLRLKNGGIGQVNAIGGGPDPLAEMAAGSITLETVTTHPTPSAFIDAAGTILEEVPGWTTAVWQVHVVKDGNGRWLIWGLEAG